MNEQEVGTVMETSSVVSLGNEKLYDTSMRLEDEERSVTFLNSSKHENYPEQILCKGVLPLFQKGDGILTGVPIKVLHKNVYFSRKGGCKNLIPHFVMVSSWPLTLFAWTFDM